MLMLFWKTYIQGPVQPAYAPPPQQSSVVVVQQPVGTTVIQGHGNCYSCHVSIAYFHS